MKVHMLVLGLLLTVGSNLFADSFTLNVSANNKLDFDQVLTVKGNFDSLVTTPQAITITYGTTKFVGVFTAGKRVNNSDANNFLGKVSGVLSSGPKGKTKTDVTGTLNLRHYYASIPNSRATFELKDKSGVVVFSSKLSDGSSNVPFTAGKLDIKPH